MPRIVRNMRPKQSVARSSGGALVRTPNQPVVTTEPTQPPPPPPEAKPEPVQSKPQHSKPRRPKRVNRFKADSPTKTPGKLEVKGKQPTADSGCHIVTKQKKRSRRLSMRRKRKGPGYGLMVCRNCRWFTEGYKKITGKRGCKGNGISPDSYPCPIQRNGFGYFEPLEFGRVLNIDITQLRRDELEMLQYRAKRREIELERRKIESLKVGQHVRAKVNEELFLGKITQLSKRRVRIQLNNGSSVVLDPMFVESDDHDFVRESI